MKVSGAMIARLFAHLTPDQISVASFYFVDGLTQEEIANEMNIARRTVYRMLEAVRSTCRRLEINEPARVRLADTRHVRNISPELMASL